MQLLKRQKSLDIKQKELQSPERKEKRVRIDVNDDVGIYAHLLDEKNEIIPLVQRADDDEGWYERRWVIDTMRKPIIWTDSSSEKHPFVLDLQKTIRIYKKDIKIVFGPETPKWALETLPEDYRRNCGQFWE